MGAIESMTEFLTQHSAGSKALYNAQLVAEELGMNIINHAYRDRDEHRIKLVMESLPGCFRLQIFDDGVAFDVRKAPLPNPAQKLEEREPGGWGTALIRRAARRMDYDRRDRLNVVTVEIYRD